VHRQHASHGTYAMRNERGKRSPIGLQHSSMYHSRDATGPERNHDSGGLARTNAMKAAGHDYASR
jgi:hypothetical protein